MYSFANFQTELKNVEEWLAREYSQISTGRAAPALLDGVQVESYGQMMPLKNVASISIEDPKTLRVAPWDKVTIKDVERGLHSSNLGFSIAVDDQGVRVIVPALTTERREQLVKLAKAKMEEARISIRQARDSEIGAIKEKELPEDAFFRAKEEMQKLVDVANGTLEAVFDRKEKEILS